MARRHGEGATSSTEITEIIARIASAQHGVIARRQILAAGIPSGLIAGRVDNGWLTTVFKGVYSPGVGLLDHRGRWMASVLAAGNPAVLSHFSAAAHHGFIDRRSGAIEVTVLTGGQRRLEAQSSTGGRCFSVIRHRTRMLPDIDVTELDGIPVTSVARAFLDVSARMTTGQLKTGLTEAEKLRILSLPDLHEVIGRGGGRAGTARLGQALAEWDPLEAETRSKLEIAMLRLCREEKIPVPVVNTALDGYLPDFLWRDHRLIIEVDGYRDHSGKGAFRGDRRRDVDLMLGGYRVARFTHAEVVRGGAETAKRIRGLLKLSGSRG